MGNGRSRGFSKRGIWWLPEQGRDGGQGGWLRFDEARGLRLQRVGLSRIPPPDTAYPVILGQTQDGALWTLAECRWSTASSGTSGDTGAELISERTIPAFAFCGAHLVDKRSRNVTSIEVSFSGLPAWLHAESFTIDTQRSREGEVAYSIGYRRADDIPVTAGNVQIVIQHVPAFPVRRRTSIFVSEHVGFWLSTSIPIPMIEWIMRFLVPLQNLMTLATGFPNAFIAPCVVSAVGEGGNPAQASLFFRHPRGLQRLHRNFAGQRLFDFPDIKERWSDVCCRWLSLYEDQDMTRVLDLYFSTQYRASTPETELQKLVAAAEVYHRARHAEDQDRLNTHRERRERVLKQIDQRDRDWAAGHLRTRIEPNLHTRLVQLATREAAAMKFVLPDTRRFVDFVESRRHELAHRGPPRVAGDQLEELVHATERLRFMLQACLLRELGFEDPQIVDFLWNNSRFAFLANRT